MARSQKNRGGYLGGGTVLVPGSSWFGYHSEPEANWTQLDEELQMKEIEDERLRVARLEEGDFVPISHPIANKDRSLRERARSRRILRKSP